MKKGKKNRIHGEAELPILITVDVCDGSFDSGSRHDRFDSLMGCLPDLNYQLKEILSEFTNRNTVPVTWFVRADMQVKEATGSATGLIEGWPEIWLDILTAGGELGWHPHLVEKSGDRWLPIRDPMRLKDEAEKIRDKFSGSAWNPRVSRMGESVGSNELMSFLDSVGIIADLSALPGRKRDDGERFFDWEITPHAPYHPGRQDYRITGDNQLSILEIPFTMAHIRAPYDSPEKPDSEFLRYIDLSYDPARLEEGLRNLPVDTGYIVAVIHPMQASGLAVPDGGLVIGGLDVVRENLGNILNFFGKEPGVLMSAGNFCRSIVAESV